MTENRNVADIPKIARQRLEATSKAGVHPDPNMLTAFAEKSLNKRERVQVLQHLGQCADCRRTISLAMPQTELAPSASPGRVRWLTWPVLRWGALAACVIVVGAAVTLRHERQTDTVAVAPEKTPLASQSPVKSGESGAARQTPQKLAANIAPPSPVQSDRDSLKAGKLAKRGADVDARSAAPVSAMDRLAANPAERKELGRAQLTNDRAVTADAVKSAVEPSPTAGQLAAAAPATPPAAPTMNAEAPITAKERNDKFDYAARAGNEAVTEEANSAPIAEIGQAASAKAKDESRKDEASKKDQSPHAGMLGGISLQDRKADTASAEMAQTIPGREHKLSRSGSNPGPRWTLSADGALQRSFDSGRSWQTIPVASNLIFRALAANDSDIWVGGTAGALYHSSDAGQHWTHIKPMADGEVLTADIIRVEFSDPSHGSVTTVAHEVWTTSDAGKSWYKK